ncbi:MAG TPA: amidase [Thermoanaerobaculia bacterium]|jgi:amidase|nr:amidase [Thermoanaerobaculia bacterium]
MSERRPPDEQPPSPPTEEQDPTALTRRNLLRWGALAGAAAPFAGLPSAAHADSVVAPAIHLEEATIAGLQAAMERGGLNSQGLVQMYIDRIRALDEKGPQINSVLEVNPDAVKIAKELDKERKAHGPRGPLHGIPIMLKANIDTADHMSTTAGSLSLVGTPPHQDATVAARLRAAGAVILGKTNLSEWANFRGFNSTSGWSGQGGQTRNPYVLDRNPCGSSSGSAASVAANLTAAGLGTETDGSIVCPATINGVVGIKPTVGLTSRAGVIPISHTQDTVGPHARTVADAAAVLSALVGVDPRDPATAASAGHFSTDYTQFLDPHGLEGKRIGVVRGGGFTGYSLSTDAAFEDALATMADAGAVLIESEIPTIDQLNSDQAEIIVLIYEFKRDLDAYLATRTGVPVHTVADIIAFNNTHADQELQFFGQEFFELAQADIFSAQEYADALVRGHKLAGPDGIDAALAADNLVALVAPTGSPAWPNDLVNGDHFLGASSSPCAVAGYPIINVPMGFGFGLPLGISFMGTAFSEGKLIGLASGFEAAMEARRRPTYIPTLPLPKGVTAFGGKALQRAQATKSALQRRIDALPPSFRARLFGAL